MTIRHLHEHPNHQDITNTLIRAAVITDQELVKLAGAGWNNSYVANKARKLALSPDSPLVIDVLTVFNNLSQIYGPDLEGNNARLNPKTASLALKAIRDAVAAVYARPILAKEQYRALHRPWRRVFGKTKPPGIAEESYQLLSRLYLGDSCHNQQSRDLLEGLATQAFLAEIDPDKHFWLDTAKEQAALALSGADGQLRRTCASLDLCIELEDFCSICGKYPSQDLDARDFSRAVCAIKNAVLGLLMRDALEPALFQALYRPVHTALASLEAQQNLDQSLG